MELTPKEELTELGMSSMNDDDNDDHALGNETSKEKNRKGNNSGFGNDIFDEGDGEDQEQGGFRGGGFGGRRPVECATQ
jgi:hypothetical protein